MSTSASTSFKLYLICFIVYILVYFLNIYMFVYLWYEIFINILTFSGYSKASQRQGVSSLQSVSTAGTRSLGNRQGIYEFFLTCFSSNC